MMTFSSSIPIRCYAMQLMPCDNLSAVKTIQHANLQFLSKSPIFVKRKNMLVIRPLYYHMYSHVITDTIINFYSIQQTVQSCMSIFWNISVFFLVRERQPQQKQLQLFVMNSDQVVQNSAHHLPAYNHCNICFKCIQV